ncbi:outer membrane lipoprotein carrier protein LolA [Candidatus Desantisbacteria bacterium]|nr:outer membrane lipoprotein carrier protein LolA [Candidatus Desantisbacteria bacterium]
MKYNKKHIIFILIILMRINMVFALTSEEIIKKIKETLKNANTMNAEFKQIINNVSLKNKQIIFGTFKLKRPDKLLMTYEKPKEMRQKLIINGNNFWLYLENNNQIMKKKVIDSEKEVEKQIFPWMENLNVYNIQILTKEEKYIKLVVSPKEKEEAPEKFKKFMVHIDPSRWIVVYTYMLDLSDNEIEFYFDNIKFNKNISDNEFEFISPPGAEILEGE